MAQAVTGFLTGDGSFYNDEVSAELHEATRDLTDQLQFRNVNPDKFFEHLHALSKEVERYLNVYKATRSEDRRAIDEADTSQDQADDEGTKADADTLQQQPPDSDQHVPNMGRRSQSKKVSHNRKSNGP